MEKSVEFFFESRHKNIGLQSEIVKIEDVITQMMAQLSHCCVCDEKTNFVWFYKQFDAWHYWLLTR